MASDVDAIFAEVMGAVPQGIPAAPPLPVTAPRPSSDVDAVFNEVMGQRDPNAPTAARVQQALTDAEGKKPEDEARRAQLAKELGTVPGLLPSLPEAEAELRRKKLPEEAADLAANSPKTSAFALVPGHAARAGVIGLTALAKLEESFPSVGYLDKSLRSGIALGSAGATKIMEQFLSFLFTSDAEIATLAKTKEDLDRMRSLPGAALGGLARSEQARSEALSAQANIIDPTHIGKEYFTSDQGKAAYRDPIRVIGDVLQSAPSSAMMALTIILTKGAATSARTEALAAGATPEAATQAAIIAATKVATTFGGISEGAVTYGQNSLSAASEVEKMALAKIAGSAEFQKYLRLGYDPEVARALLANQAGEMSGAVGGTITGLISAVGGRYLGKIVGENGAWYARLGKGMGLGAAEEGPQSYQEKVAENLAIKKYADPTRSWDEGAAEAGVQGLVLGPVMEGPMALATGKAQQAVTDRDTLNKLALDAAGNPVRENAPEAYRNFIDSLTEGRSVREVYIDTNIIRDVFAQAGVTEKELSTVFPEVAAQLADETNTEGFVKVSTADLITKIKTPEILKSVLDNARTWSEGEATPGMSFAEAETFFQTQHEGFTREAVKAAEIKAAREQHEKDMTEIRQTITDEIMSSGRYDQAVAKANAIPIAAFYEQRTKDFNTERAKEFKDLITVKDLFAENPYRARGEVEKITYLTETNATMVANGETTKVITAQATTESEPKVKQQLMQDEKGNYVWSDVRLSLARPADALFSQSPTPANNPYTLSTLATAIDKAMGRGFTKLLEATGMFKLIESSQIGKFMGEGAMFSKSSQTDTPAFKKWFGDSKVVDAEGKPLVVYHGSLTKGEGIDEFDLSKTGTRTDDGWMGQGFYFGDKRTADVYAGHSEFDPGHFPQGGVVYPVYLSIKNPAILTDTNSDGQRYLVRELVDLPDEATGAEVRSALIKAGYDGVIYRRTAGERSYREFVAFSPTQIKSVFNNGDFDASNPDIRYSKDGRILAFVKDGVTHLVYDNISSTDDNVKGLLLHEIGLHALTLGRNEPEFQAILKQFKMMGKMGNAQVRTAKEQAAAEKVDKAEGRVPKDTEKHLLDEEHLGHYLEQNPNSSFTQKVISWFRAQVRKLGAMLKGSEKFQFFQWANKLTPEDIVAMATTALKNAPTTLQNARSRGVFKADTQQQFYSQLRKVMRDAPDKIFGSGKQVALWLQANAGKLGIKKDEIFWSGITDWLDTQGKVSKADVLAFLDGNGVKVEVKVLGESLGLSPAQELEFNELLALGRSATPKQNERIAELIAISDKNEGTTPTTRHGGGNLVLPGGTNYREMLITLPTNDGIADPTNWEEASILMRKYDIPGDQAPMESDADAFARIGLEIRAKNRPTVFTSSHFSQPNIAAHIRMNDRVGANGEKILFVEEVQSDWGQTGKKEGFSKPADKSELDAMKEEMAALNRRTTGGPQLNQAEYARLDELIRLTKAGVSSTANTPGVPTAPFVTDTKAWTSLAMKHVIQEAVAGGYDSVAWTTGEQQVARYPEALRQVADHIEWKLWAPEVDGGVNKEVTIKKAGETIFRGVIEKDGKVLSSNRQQEAIGKGLDEVIGKTMAEQVLTNKTGEIAGEHFTVGGEGMKGYYDGILPQVVSGIFKQLKVEGKVGRVSAVDLREQPGFTITPALAAKVTNEGMPFFQTNNAEFDPARLMTTFFEGANLSSIIHESGHFYLEMMERLSARPDAPQKIKNDYNTFMEWFGLTAEKWAGMNNAERTPYHEQFALSQELWMLEGKSPTLKMQPLFSRFRSWMLSVYKSAEAFLQQNPSAGKLNDEVRAVFSRLIASEEAIKEAEAVRGYVPLFQTAEEAGVPQDAFDEYLAGLEEATQQSVDAVQKRSMRDLKWLSNAKSATLKKIQAQAEGFRAAIREEVTAQVMAEPINQARQAMLNGEVKMSADELGAMVTDPSVAGMVAEDGLPLDMVASQFGFPSSEALLQELTHAENAQEKIAGLTDQRMLQEHGEMIDARAIDEAVNAALVNDSRARFYASGLKILTKSGAPVSQITKAAKLAAEARIAKIPLKDLRPNQYAAVERRAALKAVELAGKNPQGAVDAQRAAILNGQLYKAALSAREEVQTEEARLKRITKPGAQKAMGGEHLLQLNALLDRLGVNSKSTQLTEATPRRDFGAYLVEEAKRLSAISPEVPAWLISEQVTRGYKSLTLTEFREVMAAVKSIEMLARREREQYAAFRGETFAEAKAKNMAVFRKNFPKLFLPNGQLKPTVTDPRHSAMKSLGDTSDAVQAALSSSEAIVDILEGGKIGDLFYSLIWPMSSRNDWKVARMEEIYKTVQPLLDQYNPFEQIAFTRADIGTKPLGFVLTRESAITIALYHGSETGRDRLSNHTMTNGQRLDTATQQKVIDLLDARDIKLANGIWEVFDRTLWPELKALDERTKGKGAPKVEAIPHRAKNGNLTGGYYEVKYDTEKDATPGSEDGAVAEMMSGHASGRRVATAQGTSIAREEHTKYRPRLDLGVFFETVNKVVNDLAYREVVADTQRMLLDPDMETVIKTAGSKVEYETLRHRVGSMVMGAQLPSGPFEKAADLARKNTSVVLLSGMWTALQNYTNLSTAANELGTANVAWETLRMHSPMGPAAFRFGMKNSVFLRNYHSSFDRTVQENSKKLTSKQKYMPNMSTWLWFMGKINQIVASITWNAAYKVAMKENQNDHNVSVIHADRRTREIVGSGRDADVTKIAEGHWLPLLNMMYSFFNSQLMLLMKKSTLLKRTLKSDESAAFKAKAVALYAKSWFMIVAIPAILGDMALGAFRGDPDKDDEDKLTHYLKVIGLYNIAFIPGGGSIGAFLYRKGLGMDSYGLKISPVEAAITGVAAGAGSAVDIWNDEGDIKDVANEIMALSYMLGLPGSFIKNAVVGGVAYADDTAGPEAMLFGPPKELKH